MARPEQFSYRKLIKAYGGKPDWYSDRLQADFDTIDRMVALIGDIPFEELFARPLAVVLTRIQANVCRARPGLIKHPGEVQELLDALVEMTGDRSFCELVHCKRGEYPEGVDTALYTLVQRHGIHFPLTNYYRPKNYRRALRDLIEYAGKRTYLDVFRKCQCKLPQNEKSALYYAWKERLIQLGDSSFCCNTNNKCQAAPSGSCVNGTNGCVPGYTTCGASPLPRRLPNS
ncbi:MAG TPA: hypothetical protein VFA07_06400 [Chthonomonadaceae bacterium]|nr:hypothetical protein [Chthonomonadaceae bacterium]